MPRIPVIGQNQVAAVPAAVLDRQRRPTVSNAPQIEAAGLVGRVAQQPDINAAPFVAPYDAMGSVGRAIAQTGSIIGAAAQKFDEAVSIRQTADASNRITLETGKFLADRENMPPEQWEAERAKRFSPLRTQLLSQKGLTRQAASDIAVMFDERDARLGATNVMESMKHANKLARSAILSGIETAAQAGDKTKHSELVAGGVSGGHLYDFEVPELDRQYEDTQKRNEQRARVQMMDDAATGALKVGEVDGLEAGRKYVDQAAELGGWSPLDKEIVLNKVEQVARSSESRAVDDIADGIIENRLTTGQHLAEALDAYPLVRDNAQVKEKLWDFMRKKAENDKDAEHQLDLQQNRHKYYAEMFQKVAAYDRKAFKTDEEAQMAALDIRMEIAAKVPNPDSGALRETLYSKQTAVARPPEVPKSVKGYVDDTIKHLFREEGGPFSWVKEDENGKKVEDPKLKENAYETMWRLKEKVETFLQQHPEKAGDIDAIKEFMMKEALPKTGTERAFRAMMPKSAAASSVNVWEFSEPQGMAINLPQPLRPYAKDFVEAGRQYGINPKVLAAISALETAGGTSSAFRNKNNAMGISNSKGPVSLESVRDSIFRQARTLAKEDGPYANAKTIDQIAKIYAPPGAGNDPKGTNPTWSAGVKQWLARL